MKCWLPGLLIGVLCVCGVLAEELTPAQENAVQTPVPN